MFKKTKNILNCFVLVITITLFVAPYFSLADEGTAGGDEGRAGGGTNITIEINNPFKCAGQANCTVYELIRTIVNDILLPIGGVLAVLMIMYAGFMYVTAKGDPGKIKAAHDALLWAVIGAAILLGAWVISEAIRGTINQLKTP